MLGEAYSTHGEEDMAAKEVTAIIISLGRYGAQDNPVVSRSYGDVDGDVDLPGLSSRNTRRSQCQKNVVVPVVIGGRHDHFRRLVVVLKRDY